MGDVETAGPAGFGGHRGSGTGRAKIPRLSGRVGSVVQGGTAGLAWGEVTFPDYLGSGPADQGGNVNNPDGLFTEDELGQWSRGGQQCQMRSIFGDAENTV